MEGAEEEGTCLQQPHQPRTHDTLLSSCGLVVDCGGAWKYTLTERDLAEGDCRMQYARAPRYQRAMG